MEKALSLIKISYLRSRVYLAGHVINMFGSFIFGYIGVCVWRALLGDTPKADRMATYVIVSQSLLWVTMFLPKSAYLYQKVRDGTLAFMFVRPMGMFLQSFYEVSGSAVYNFIYRSIPIFLLGLLFLGTGIPAPGMLLPFFISIIPAYVISFCLNYFVGIWSVKFLNFTAAQNIYYFLANLLSGSLAPADYFPDSIKSIIAFSPFSSTCYIPSKIFIGEMNPFVGIPVQSCWAVILVLLSLILTKSVKKSVQIQGG